LLDVTMPVRDPTSQRQKDGARPVRLAAITRIGKSHQAGALFIARRNRRLSRHAIHLANRRRQRTAKNLSVG
jgi:hypothetical protein